MARPERVICASASLRDAAKGVRFELEAPADAPMHFVPTGFAVRYLGKVHGYVNRCPHQGTELDWQPGEFFEEAGVYLVCSTHGALFEPQTGLCVAGPCRGASLVRLALREEDGQVILADNPHNEMGTP
jgi:nitrite reductase/ring-hydroxylating ferredoxin subunit